MFVMLRSAVFGFVVACLLAAPVGAQQVAPPDLTLEAVRPVIAEVMGISPDAIEIDSGFEKDLGGDMLDLVEVVMEIEERFMRVIPEHELNGLTTVRDMIYAFNTPDASLYRAPNAQKGSIEPSQDLLLAMDTFDFGRATRMAEEEYAACQAAHPGECLKILAAMSDSSMEEMRLAGVAPRETERIARQLLDAVDPAFDSYRVEGLKAQHNLGLALMEQGRLKEAEDHLREAMRLVVDRSTRSLWEPYEEGKQMTPFVELRRVALDMARNLALQERFEAAVLAFGAANVEANHHGYGAYDRNGASVMDGGPTRSRSHKRDIVDDYTQFGAVLSLIERSGLDMFWWRDQVDGDASYYFELAYGETDAMPAEAFNYRQLLDAEYGIHLERSGRHEEASDFLTAALDDGWDVPSARGRLYLASGTNLIALGDRTAGLERLALAADYLGSTMPPENVDRISAEWEYAKALHAAGLDSGEVFEQAAAGAAESSFQGRDPAEEARLLRRYSALFVEAVEAAMRENGDHTSPEKPFYNAQLAGASETAAALAQVSAAMADGSGEMATLEARRRALVTEQGEAERKLLTWTSLPGAYIDDATSQLATRYRTLTRQVVDAEDEMRARDPAYFDLVRPRPLSLADVQSLLRPDEALLFLMAGEAGTTTFAVSKTQASSAFAADMGEAELTERIKLLRTQLQNDLDGNSRGLEREVDPDQKGFDPVAAHQIYRSLLAPLEGVFGSAGKLLVVTTGPLGSLPLQILPTARPTGAAPDYFGDKFAMATLPAVSSLRSLRCLRGGTTRPAACGASPAPDKPAGASAIALAAVGSPTLQGAPASSRGAPSYAGAFSGDLADTEFLRNLPYLPGTLEELKRIEQVFAGEKVIVRTGDEARESFVRTDPGIASAQYIVLSTHGLLESETGLIGEPGLVFTPPAKELASPADDGLLTASEAAQMSLVADLLVLSACNTASSDGKLGAEGLSGLAKSFLYAGAKALLVSHWPVDDSAGAEIVSLLLQQGQRTAADPATALRQAALKVRDNPKWASPAFWAPFVLVGLPE